MQFSQLHHSMANVKNLHIFLHIVALALTVSEIIQMFNVLLPKSMSRLRNANIKNYKCHFLHFCFAKV